MFVCHQNDLHKLSDAERNMACFDFNMWQLHGKLCVHVCMCVCVYSWTWHPIFRMFTSIVNSYRVQYLVLRTAQSTPHFTPWQTSSIKH